MDNPVVYIVLIVVVLGVVFVVRSARGNRTMEGAVAELCRELGAPNAPFDITRTARDVVAGTRPGVPRDGQWWLAPGIEQVGRPSMTRLLEEDAVPDEETVRRVIATVFDDHRGSSELDPRFKESSMVGNMTRVHQDIILARITGRQRPIGG